MRIEDCSVGQEVAIKDVSENGYLVGEVVGVSAERVRVKFRNAENPRPVSVHPRRIWTTADQLSLFQSTCGCMASAWRVGKHHLIQILNSNHDPERMNHATG